MKKIVISSVILFGMLITSILSIFSPGTLRENPASATSFQKGIPALKSPTPRPEMSVNTPTRTTPSNLPITSGEETVMITPVPLPDPLTISIIYDNNPNDHRVETAWGFSALVKHKGHTLLFDAGGNGDLLLENMKIMGIDPMKIETIMVSHNHGDHTDGLLPLLKTGIHPSVIVPASLPASFRQQIAEFTQVIEPPTGQPFAGDFFTTGTIEGNIPEQSLIIPTEKGLVIVTGCAHPGIVEIVNLAIEQHHKPVRLVVGGFHLGNKNETEINSILDELHRAGVESAAPCHCSGDRAISIFSKGFGDYFIQTGAGKVILLDGEEE